MFNHEMRETGCSSTSLFCCSDAFRLHGLYVESLCEGIRATLSPYRAALARLEREVLEGGGGGVTSSSSSSSTSSSQLTSIQHALAPYHPVLLAINSLVKQVSVATDPTGLLV